MRKIFLALLTFSVLAIACNEQKNETTETTTVNTPAPESTMDETGTQKLMSVLVDYYGLKDALVASNGQKADEAMTHLSADLDSFQAYLVNDTINKMILNANIEAIQVAGRELLEVPADGTEVKRVHFEKISDAMYAILKKVELQNASVYRQYCPMAFDDKGAYWLSNEDEIKNPYFGKKMLECGEVTDSLK